MSVCFGGLWSLEFALNQRWLARANIALVYMHCAAELLAWGSCTLVPFFFNIYMYMYVLLFWCVRVFLA